MQTNSTATDLKIFLYPGLHEYKCILLAGHGGVWYIEGTSLHLNDIFFKPILQQRDSI